MNPENSTPQPQEKLVSVLESAQLFDVKTVGPNTISAISIMGEKENLAGNVLRRMCRLGGEACAQTCSLHQEIVERTQENIDKKCADENLKQIVYELGANPDNVLMIGVTADSVGFADEIDSNPEKYKYSVSPVTGIKELPGFNAFFTAEGDSVGGLEVSALGRRLADCGDMNIEFTAKDGRKIMGFMHLTRTNLEATGSKFVRRTPLSSGRFHERRVGVYEYFLRSAEDHYGGLDPRAGINVRIGAAIKKENFIYKFENEAKIDELFPGWKDFKEMDLGDHKIKNPLRNVKNPEWQPGDHFDSNDTWEVDFREMIARHINSFNVALGITRVNGKPYLDGGIDWTEVIDPGDADSEHASNARGKKDQDKDGRDAYFTAWADKLQPNL